MKQQFEINFDFPVAHSDVKISLWAKVKLQHSEPHYIVFDFHNKGARDNNSQVSILPTQEIKRVKKGKSPSWVHCDSERESLLSIAIGKAIEKVLGDNVESC